MDKVPFFSKTLVKWEKVLQKFPHQSVYDANSIDRRLFGGGDGDDDEHTYTAITNQPNINTTNSTSNIPVSSPNQDENHQQVLEQQEVNEIIRNAIQNLQETSISLVNLAENHEHELKILFLAAVAKLQICIDDIQEKLNLTKTALNSLQFKIAIKDIEVRAKTYELDNLRSELSKCREEISKATNHVSQTTALAVRNASAVDANTTVPNVDVAINPSQVSTISTQTLQTINTSAASEVAVHSNSPQKTTIFTVSSSYKVKKNESLPDQTATSHSMIITIEPSTDTAINQYNNSSHVLIHTPTTPSITSNINVLDNSINSFDPQTASETTTLPLANVFNYRSASGLSLIPEASSAAENIAEITPVIVSVHQIQAASENLTTSNQPTYTIASSATIGPINQQTSSKSAVRRPKGFSMPPSTVTFSDLNRPPIVNYTGRQPTQIPSSQLTSSFTQQSVASTRVQNTTLIQPTIVDQVPTQPNIQHDERPIISINGQVPTSSGTEEPYLQQREAERDEREAQLMAEIAEVRRENERLRRDRIDYEQTVQKTLLKGMSSLNSEAMKILPNPPLICYRPCHLPCNSYFPSSVSNMATNIPGPSETVDDHYIQAENNLPINEKNAIRSKKQSRHLGCFRTTKTCSQNNMIFLMPKNNIDNACINVPQFYANADNIEAKRTVCHGGICNTGISKAQKQQKHLQSAIIHNSREDMFNEYIEAIGCSDTVKASGEHKAQKFTRTGYYKSRRFINK